jgi:hypothetical protein
MKEFVNEFQTVYKIVPSAPEEAQDINIKGYNSITIINNVASNIISWNNTENYILPNGVVYLKGDTDEFITGFLRIIMQEQVIGFPQNKVVLIKKRYNNATV